MTAAAICSLGVESGEAPWLTVVMPVHNGAAFLRETLESLSAEWSPGIEVIIIDSSDDGRCGDIVADFRHLGADYSVRPALKPWPAKTNEAVRRARAGHIAMLHQDDLWLPGRAEGIRSAIRHYPEAAMHVSPSFFIDDRGRKIGRWGCPLNGHALWTGPELAKRLLAQNFIAIPAPVIRRADWLAVGGMDEALWYTADWDLYLKLAGRGNFSYAPHPATAFRIHSRSLTVTGSKSPQDFKAQMEIVVERHLPRLSVGTDGEVAKLARASVQINAALAGMINGDAAQFSTMLREMMRMRPGQLARYLRYSRLLDRLIPRIRTLYGAAR